MSNTHRRNCARVAVALLIALLYLPASRTMAQSSPPKYAITDLGTLIGGTTSVATGINKYGNVSGYSGLVNRHSYGFLYTAASQTMGAVTSVDWQGYDSTALGINDKNEIVGSFSMSNFGPYGFTWQDGVTTRLVAQSNGDSYPCVPACINNQGQVGGVNDNRLIWLTVWENDGTANIIGIKAFADAINDNGVVVGSAHNIDGASGYAYSWSKSKGFANLGIGGESVAYGINNAGQIVGASGASFNSWRGFILSNGVRTDLGTLGGNFSPAYALNSLGQVVGYSNLVPSGPYHAFIWQNGNMQDLNSLIPAKSGWTLTEAKGINDSGQICGTGINPDGQQHAFLLTPTISSENLKMVGVTNNGSEYPVDGIVCDNLRDVKDNPQGYQRDFIKITVPQANYPDADFSVTPQISNTTNGHFEYKSDEIDYYPPDEFNTNPAPADVSQVDKAATRTVTLNIRFKSGDKTYVVAPEDIVIARPPVMLVHGINSDPSRWIDLVAYTNLTQGIRVPFTYVDHSDTLNGNGPVELGAHNLVLTIDDTLDRIRTGKPLPNGATQLVFIPNSPLIVLPVDFTDFSNYNGLGKDGLHLAVRRVDVVGWSYGGVITRWYIASDGKDMSKPNDSTGSSWYKRKPFQQYNVPHLPAYRGDIRKFITTGSMWRGVPLINYLNEAAFGNTYPSPSGYDFGTAPVGTTTFGEAIVSLRGLTNFFDRQPIAPFVYTPRVYVPSMEVLAVNSPWMSQLIYHDPFQNRYGPPFPQPFRDDIAYGSVAGDNKHYPLIGFFHNDVYATVNILQHPSWFPYLPLEQRDDSYAHNFSDGLVPIWSSAIPGSYTIAPVTHDAYASNTETQDYILQEMNNANLKMGPDLNLKMGSDLNLVWQNHSEVAKVSTYNEPYTWTFMQSLMAPYPQSDFYQQVGGIGRLNPQAFGPIKPELKPSISGRATLNGNDIVVNVVIRNLSKVLAPGVYVSNAALIPVVTLGPPPTPVQPTNTNLPYLPMDVRTVGAGGSQVVTLRYPRSAGPSGTTMLLHMEGGCSYPGNTFIGTIRVTLP